MLVFLISLSFVLGEAMPCGHCAPGTTPEKIVVSFCNMDWARHSFSLQNCGWGWEGTPYNSIFCYMGVDLPVSNLKDIVLKQNEWDSCSWVVDVSDAIGLRYSNVNGYPNEENKNIWEKDWRYSYEVFEPPLDWSERVGLSVELGKTSASIEGEGYTGWSLWGMTSGQQSALPQMIFFQQDFVLDDPEVPGSNDCSKLPHFVDFSLFGQQSYYGAVHIGRGGVYSEKSLTFSAEFYGNAIEKDEEKYYYLGKKGEFKDSEGKDIGGEIGCKIKMPSCDGWSYINGRCEEAGGVYTHSEIGLIDEDNNVVYSQAPSEYEFNQTAIYDSPNIKEIFGQKVRCYVKLTNMTDDLDEEVIVSEDSAVLIPRNLKDMDFFEENSKSAFLVSDDNWKDAIKMIPAVTMFRGNDANNPYFNAYPLATQNIDKNCLEVSTRIGGISKCAYPLLVYNSAQLQEDGSSGYVNWISSPSDDINAYGNVRASSTGFLSELYHPDNFVFLGNAESRLNKKINAKIKTISSADELWKTQGVVVVVPSDDLGAAAIATEVATEFEAPIVFSDDSGFDDKITNKFVIYVSSTKSTSDENIGNIATIKEKGFLLKYHQVLAAYPSYFSIDESETTTDSNPSFPTSSDRPYAGVQDYIYSITKPTKLALVNPYGVGSDFCSSKGGGCKGMIFAAILSISDAWTVDFINDETPWKKISSERHVFNEKTPIQYLDDDVRDKKEEVSPEISAAGSRFEEMLRSLNKLPYYLFIASPSEIPMNFLTINYDQSKSCGKEPKVQEVMQLDYTKLSSGRTIGADRLFSESIYATSSTIADMLFSLMPDCPDITSGKIVVTKDKRLPPRIEYLLGASIRLYGSRTWELPKRWANLRKTFNEEKIFPDARALENYLALNPITSMEGINTNKDKNLNAPVSCYLRPEIKVPGYMGMFYGVYPLKDEEAEFLVSFYYSELNKLRYGLLYSAENIAQNSKLLGNCSDFPEIDSFTSELFGQDIIISINKIKQDCMSTAGSSDNFARFNEMGADINVMIAKENMLLAEATKTRDLVNQFVDDAVKSGHIGIRYETQGSGALESKVAYYKTLGETLDGKNNPELKKEINNTYKIWAEFNKEVEELVSLRDAQIKRREDFYQLTIGDKFRELALGDDLKSGLHGRNQYGNVVIGLQHPGEIVNYYSQFFIDRAIDLNEKICPGEKVWVAMPSSFNPRGGYWQECEEFEKGPIIRNAVIRQLKANKDSLIQYFKDAQDSLKCIHTYQPWSHPNPMVTWQVQYDTCAGGDKLAKLLGEKSPLIMSFTQRREKILREDGKEIPMDDGKLDIKKLATKQPIVVKESLADSYFNHAETVYQSVISEKKEQVEMTKMFIIMMAGAASFGLTAANAAVYSAISFYIAGAVIDTMAVGASYSVGRSACKELEGDSWGSRLGPIGETINPKLLNLGPGVATSYTPCLDGVNYDAVINTGFLAIEWLALVKMTRPAATARFMTADSTSELARSLSAFESKDAAVREAMMLQVNGLRNSAVDGAKQITKKLAEIAAAKGKTPGDLAKLQADVRAYKESTAKTLTDARKIADDNQAAIQKSLDGAPPAGSGDDNLRALRKAVEEYKCFIAGTIITMSDGTEKKIEDIAVGDRVVSYDIASGKLINSSVEKLIRSIRSDMINITFSSGKSNVNTFDHPYWVVGKGWSSYKPDLTLERYSFDNVEQLEVGDKVLVLNGSELVESEVLGIREDIGEVQTYIFNVKNENPQKMIEYEIIGG